MNQTNSGRKPINAGDDTSIFNAQSNGNGGSSTQRSPLNSGAINPGSSRYETSPPTTSTNNNASNRNYTPPQHQANSNNNNTARTNVTARQQQALGQHQSRNLNANHQNNETTPRQTSPTRSNQNVPEGFRIAKRELWWKEPGASGHKVLTNDKPKIDHVAPKVDCYNNEYNPNRQNTKLIESKKLEWNANHGIHIFIIYFYLIISMVFYFIIKLLKLGQILNMNRKEEIGATQLRIYNGMLCQKSIRDLFTLLSS